MDLEFSVQAPRQSELKDSYDVVIIGGGPAGLTAGIYASRGNLSTLVINKGSAGGLMASTEWVENFPGFPDGVAGAELGRKMQAQAQRFGTEIFSGEPEGLDLGKTPKEITLYDRKVTAQAVIVATGTTPKRLGVPGERELYGKGVSYCATCDGPFFRDKNVVVVGAGSSGVQESLFLAKFASQISIVEFLPTIQAEQILVERLKRAGKAEFLLNHQVLGIEGDEKVEGVKVRDRESGQEKLISCSGVFIYVGLLPQSKLLEGQLELDRAGYVVTDARLATNLKGVWGAGDVISGAKRQIVVAAGTGAAAAIEAEEYINTL